jgi:cold shock CspA family protein
MLDVNSALNRHAMIIHTKLGRTLDTLRENQRVRFTQRAGQKGPEADSLEVI